MHYGLVKKRYRVRCFTLASQALSGLKAQFPDLFIVDEALGGEMDGWALVRRLRKMRGLMLQPVILVSARASEADYGLAKDTGADALLCKPVNFGQLALTTKTLLGRGGSPEALAGSRAIRQGPLLMNPETRRCTLGRKRIKLCRLEFTLLYHFVTHPGVVYKQTDLLRIIGSRSKDTRTVDAYVSRLRKKLGSHRGWIKNWKRVGYCWKTETEG
jgi:DNA-binding response OmpR family regulator